MNASPSLIQSFTVYGILLATFVGFAGVSLWKTFYDTGLNLTKERAGLSSLDLIIDGLQDANRKNSIRTELNQYIESVTLQEFPYMSITTNKGSNPDTAEHYKRLWSSVYNQQSIDNETDKVLYQTIGNILNKNEKHRKQRIFESDSTIPAYLWGLMILGVLVASAYPFLIDYPNISSLTIFGSAALSILGIAILYLIYELDQPYAGWLRLKAKNFV
jgi:hypothetical protein